MVQVNDDINSFSYFDKAVTEALLPVHVNKRSTVPSPASLKHTTLLFSSDLQSNAAAPIIPVDAKMPTDREQRIQRLGFNELELWAKL